MIALFKRITEELQIYIVTTGKTENAFLLAFLTKL